MLGPAAVSRHAARGTTCPTTGASSCSVAGVAPGSADDVWCVQAFLDFKGSAGIYYAGIGRSGTCAGLGLENCDAFEADVTRIETPGVIGKQEVNEMSMTEHLNAGGRIQK